MKFGLFYEHQLPRPWGKDAEEQLMQNALDQIELADRVGFDYVWEVEHHFLEEYSHSSASEVFLGAVSQRTEKIRLGFGIVPMPPQYQHPARVAEKTAMLDLLSRGRVDLGTGESSSGIELAGFGIDRNSKREQWQEALEVTTRMMVEEPFSGHSGSFIQMPQRNVVPKPKQKPHPPLWVACSRRDTIRTAAENGIGALSFSFIEPEQAKEWVDEYYAIINSDRCTPAGYAVNPNFAVVLPMMCHQDEQTAIDRGIDGANFFGYSLAHYYVFGQHRPGFTDLYEEYVKGRAKVGYEREIVEAKNEPLGLKLVREGFGSLRGAIGTPEQVTELLRRYEQAGVDQVIFVMQAGSNKHEHICESIELFAESVMPEFSKRDSELRNSRLEKLKPAIDEALKRKPTNYPLPDPDYSVAPLASGSSTPQKDQPVGNTLVNDGLGLLIKRLGYKRSANLFNRPKLQRLLLQGLNSNYQPTRAKHFLGKTICYQLTTASGQSSRWAVQLDTDRINIKPKHQHSADLTVKVSVENLLKITCLELNPNEALLDGRVQAEGDLALLQSLGEIFGAASP